jgi:uncharacterized protein YgiM (DUF1202 family)
MWSWKMFGRNRNTWLLVLLMGLLVVACGPQSRATGPLSDVTPTADVQPADTATATVEPAFTPTSTPEPVDTATPTVEPAYPTPTETAVPTADADPDVSDTSKPVLMTDVRINVRTGPGLEYEISHVLSPNTTVPILGRNTAGNWWVVPGAGDGRGPVGWVASWVVLVEGDVSDVPVLPTPPLPEPELPVLGNSGAPKVNVCVVAHPGPGGDPVYVYSAPGESSEAIGRLGLNRWAEAVRLQDGWYEIVLQPAVTGWVDGTDVARNSLCPTPASGPVRIEFAPGTSSATLIGQVIGAEPAEFLLWAAAGQKLTVEVASPGAGARLQIEGVSDGEVYKDLLDGDGRWEGILAVSQDYRLIVDGIADGTVTYTLNVSVADEATPEPQPDAVRIEFDPGSTSASIAGALSNGEQARYVLWAAAGQRMSVSVISPQNSVLFHIAGLSDGQVYKHLLDGESEWEGSLTVSQDYLLTLDAVVAQSYTLRVWVVQDVPVILDPGAPPTNTCVASNPETSDDPIWVYLGPGEQFTVVARLGNWAEVLKSNVGWHMILIAPGYTGWLKDAQVTLSGPCALPQQDPVRIQFPTGAISTTVEGMLEPPQRDFYVFHAQDGQRVWVQLLSEFGRGNFGLSGVADGQPYKRVEDEARLWSAVLSATQDYLLTVAAPADAPTTGYRFFLTIEPLDAP